MIRISVKALLADSWPAPVLISLMRADLGSLRVGHFTLNGVTQLGSVVTRAHPPTAASIRVCRKAKAGPMPVRFSGQGWSLNFTTFDLD